MVKIPEVAYYSRKIETTGKKQLQQEWQDAPICQREYYFLCDIQNRWTLQELAEKYSLSVSGIAKWKQRLYIRLHRYDMKQLKR